MGQFVAGIDIGSATSKVVILREGKIAATSLIRTGAESAETAQRAMEMAVEEIGLGLADLDYIVATGYGRIIVPFAHQVITEIACHAKGIHFVFPQVRTILDMGGQDCKAIRVDERGLHTNFAMNDKCAAGTGRFLEAMARALDLPIQELGPLSLQSSESVAVSSMCAVFAKSEVTAMARRGIPKSTILAGLHEAIAERVHSLLKRVGIEPDFAISGGIAKNVGVVHHVEQRLGLKAHIAPEPQIMGALGAALFGAERVGNS
ncbi:MAG: 2-hydroxyglutaryl-CoA dehydratase [Candidatus Tectomicrobia bacterium]|uniref:2-hydroxyglutaryl-CoA dehydratase n=1 Tax=Tectimicrobiota bacterium TaxID=2528274 RepID=A0A932CQE9_UNCTE|nr:2-hydroxyglutaryl-CoA dehydratase [Candidatus Tectomicrobia bacterium]